MLVLVGTLRAATTLGGGINKKTGEVIPERKVLQIETIDGRGLVQMSTITVPELKGYEGKVGQSVNVPVRAWAQNAVVNYMYENPVQKAA